MDDELPIDDALRKQLDRMRALAPSRAPSLAMTNLEECLHWLTEATAE